MRVAETYQALLQISQKMVACACDMAWDELAGLEAQRSALIAALPKNALALLSSAEKNMVVALIQQIQGCNQTIEEHLLPWQAQVGQLLSHFSP